MGTNNIPIPSTLDEVRIERLKEWEIEKRAPKTGYDDLNNLIKGFIPGHLYTLTGDTNVGKSSLAANFAVKLAKQGKRVLYVALEPGNTIIEYVASVYHDKQFNELTKEDLDLKDISIDILGKEHNITSAQKMVNLIKTYVRYDLVIIDHIGYFITGENNYLQEQGNAIKQLVSIAKTKSCAVMIIAHLRKRGKGDRKVYTPIADDISGSAAFKQDSTDVLIATRDIDTNDEDKLRYTNTGKLYVVKTKSGPNGSISLFFSDRKAKITSSGENMNKLVTSAQDIFSL